LLLMDVYLSWKFVTKVLLFPEDAPESGPGSNFQFALGIFGGILWRAGVDNACSITGYSSQYVGIK